MSDPRGPVERARDAASRKVWSEAHHLFAEADKALQSQDLAGYQAKIDEARALVQQAVDALGQG